MHAIRGGWVGQTFALATSNESGGRKARIRRSKEERKAMVESFIKKYQSTNHGKFPSLNLTHKEVGGSFYTVREIVRDIIQENRVLGPAKFCLEEQNIDGITSVFLPGSSSVKSQDYLFQLGNENPAALNPQASGSMELNVNGNMTCADNLLDGGELVRSVTEKSDGLVCAESLPSENLEDNKETDFVDSSMDCHGNVCTELNLLENRQLIEHEDVTAEQFVNGSQIGDPNEELFTKSSVGKDLEVRIESRCISTDLQGKGELELRFNDDEQRNEYDGLDVGNFVNSSQIDASGEITCVDSSLGKRRDTDTNPGMVGAGAAELINPGEDVYVEAQRNGYEGLDVVNFVNSSQINESGEVTCVDSSLDEKHDIDTNPGLVGVVAAELINPGEEVSAETFPSQPFKDICTSNLGSSVYTKKLESSCVESENDDAVLDKVDLFVSGSEPVAEKVVNDPEVASSNGELVIRETARNDASNLQEAEDLSQSGETTPCHDGSIITSHDNMASSKMVDEAQRMTRAGASDDQNSNSTNHLSGANTGGGSNSSRVELITDRQAMSGSLNGVQEKDAALKESRATLDRINLGSWEGAPKKSLDQEGNPLVAVFRALVSALVKIFS